MSKDESPQVLGSLAGGSTFFQKTAIVAGATGAIGRATCAALLRRGATVIGFGRDQERLDTLQRDLAPLNGRFTSVQMGGLSENSWHDAIRRALMLHSPVDLFVHAIGALIPGAVLELKDREIRAVIETNLLSVVSATRAIAPHMIARGSGHLVVVASLGGLVPMPYQAIYSATKFGVRGFCLSLHEELRPHGVWVSMVSPGPVRSPMLAVERSDPRAVLVSVGQPADPGRVAADIIRTIYRPSREIVDPGVHRFTGAIVNAIPEVFGLILSGLVRRRLRKDMPRGGERRGVEHEFLA